MLIVLHHQSGGCDIAAPPSRTFLQSSKWCHSDCMSEGKVEGKVTLFCFTQGSKLERTLFKDIQEWKSPYLLLFIYVLKKCVLVKSQTANTWLIELLFRVLLVMKTSYWMTEQHIETLFSGGVKGALNSCIVNEPVSIGLTCVKAKEHVGDTDCLTFWHQSCFRMEKCIYTSTKFRGIDFMTWFVLRSKKDQGAVKFNQKFRAADSDLDLGNLTVDFVLVFSDWSLQQRGREDRFPHQLCQPHPGLPRPPLSLPHIRDQNLLHPLLCRRSASSSPPRPVPPPGPPLRSSSPSPPPALRTPHPQVGPFLINSWMFPKIAPTFTGWGGVRRWVRGGAGANGSISRQSFLSTHLRVKQSRRWKSY